MTQHKELIERLRSGSDAEEDAWTDSGIISGMEYTMDAAAEAIVSLERENEALRKDAERLDWLEASTEMHGFCHTQYGEYRHYAHQQKDYPSVRAVIDAAKGAENVKKS